MTTFHLTVVTPDGCAFDGQACTISLSDLLTPWDKIEKRLVAAAEGDFVIAQLDYRYKSPE